MTKYNLTDKINISANVPDLGRKRKAIEEAEKNKLIKRVDNYIKFLDTSHAPEERKYLMIGKAKTILESDHEILGKVGVSNTKRPEKYRLFQPLGDRENDINRLHNIVTNEVVRNKFFSDATKLGQTMKNNEICYFVLQ